MTAALAVPADTTSSDAPDEACVEELVRENMPLVGYLVRDLVNRLPSHVSRDELISAGMLALVVSAQSFDSSHGIPFARYAAIRIRGALTDELRSMDWASRGVRGKARELHSVRVTLAATLGRSPTRHEVAHTMGVDVRDVDSVDADVQRASVLSLHALAPDMAGNALPAGGDGPEGLLLKREQLGYLRDAVDELPERLRVVVQQYFFERRTMIHIAAQLGVTESRISQLRSEALALLRAGLQASDSEASSLPAPETGKRRAAAREAYCAAVTARSSLVERLEATNLLGESRHAVSAA